MGSYSVCTSYIPTEGQVLLSRRLKVTTQILHLLSSFGKEAQRDEEGQELTTGDNEKLASSSDLHTWTINFKLVQPLALSLSLTTSQ